MLWSTFGQPTGFVRSVEWPPWEGNSGTGLQQRVAASGAGLGIAGVNGVDGADGIWGCG